MIDITNIQQDETANCECGNRSCASGEAACSCQERNRECGCNHTAARQ